MTATQQIKTGLMAYLGEIELAGVSVVDPNQRAEFILPILAVDVPACEVFNQALPMVHKAEITVTLRAHSGDEDEASIDTWTDLVESALHDRSALTDTLNSSGIRVYEWTYNGSLREWDEAVLHITFTAECVVQRIG